jgi:predicted MPP superfamily phosphohydrolase
MIIIFISIISVILALVHLVIYKAVVSIFSLSLFWRTITCVLLAVFCLSFILASILVSSFNNLFTRIYYTISAIWLGVAFYLFLASCMYVLMIFILRIFGVNTSLEWFGILFIALALIVSIYGVVHARNIVVKNVNVVLPNLPISWQGKKAVYISDVHLGAIYGEDFSESIVEKINKINPDIVFIGGDLYDGVKVNETEVVKPFTDLHPALGTYFVTGNHEEFRDVTHYLEVVKNAGVIVLNDQMVTIDGLQLVGVDDRDSTNPAKFQAILAGLNINKNEPSILLKHQPLQLDEAAQAGISLQISGHTHKAQVFPLNIFTHMMFKGYDYGLKMYKDMAVYTSSGVGTWGPPLRVGSDSEIVVFTFTAK